MTKNLSIKVKIHGDNTLYDLTEFKDGDSIECFDANTGNHLDFEWGLVEGFTSTNPKLFSENTSTTTVPLNLFVNAVNEYVIEQENHLIERSPERISTIKAVAHWCIKFAERLAK